MPVILGTPRQGRMSEHAAKLMWARVGQRSGVETELIDIAALPIPVDDAGEALKDSGVRREDESRGRTRDRYA